MDMNEMLKQAQSMQRKVEEAREEINESIFTSEESKAVVVEMYGTKIVRDVKVKSEALADVEILQDLIAIAINDCVKQINDFSEERMASIAPGLGGIL